MKLSVVTWNVLAAAYAHPERYPRTSAADLAAGPRWARILDRLRELDADVVCLQEVEPALFAAAEGVLVDHRGWYGQKRGKPDGCAVFARSPFTAASHEVLHLRAVAPGQAHVAVLVQGGCAGEDVGVVSAHLRWQPPGTPADGHLGRLQLAEILDRTAALGGRWIVCGDFNAEVDSVVLDEARARGFDEACRGQQPDDTVNIDGRLRKLDHVLFPAGAWTAEPDALPPLAADAPMPSPEHPSDHLPVRVTFTAS